MRNRSQNYLVIIKQIRDEKIEHMSVQTDSLAASELFQRKTAEAEAAKIRVHYTEQELLLLKGKTSAKLKQTDIDTEIELLRMRREAVVLETSALGRLSNTSVSLPDVREDDPMKRVQHFVNNAFQPDLK